MNQAAFLKYYRDFNLFNVVFSVIGGIYFGAFSGVLIFCSFGLLIGYLGFNYFRKNEYYLYHNLGFSKRYLLKKVFLYNLLVSLPLLLIFAFFL
ncbi:MAG: hypothetical protein WBL21_04955 [Salinimicrobium sp.]